MDIAKHRPTGKTFRAAAFAQLSPGTLAEHRSDLECEGCGKSAYFAKKRRSGTSYYFGARHVPGCGFATSGGDDPETAKLLEAARREAEDGVVRLVADRARARTGEQVEHDPDGAEHTGRARQYVGVDGARRTTGTMQMKSLLRALDRDPEFARSDYRLRLEDGTETTVRDYCVELADVAQKHRKRRQLYWGSVMFARPDAGERGGAWLFTAKGEPNLLVTQELVAHIGELDELAGALFMVWGWLNVPKNRPDGQPYLIVSDPHRLTLSLAD